jgi:type VI secretion system protein ImpH
MNTEAKQKNDLIKYLQAETSSFEFHQAVRIILHFLKTEKGTLFFKINPSLAFSVSELKELQHAVKEDEAHLFDLSINFMGLIGAAAILPDAYSELLLERLQAKDPTFLAFLNLFQNKLIHLFYKLSTFSHYYLSYELKEPHPIMDGLNAVIGEEVNNAPKALQDTLYHHAGLLGMQARGAEGLRLWLENYFDLEVQICPYKGEWIALPKNSRSELGQQKALTGLVLGKRIWHVQNKLTILIGPIDYSDFSDFVPGTEMFEAFNQIVKLYLGLEYDYEIKVLLKKENLSAVSLGKKGMKLGWGAWLKPQSAEIETGVLNIRLSSN